MKYRCFSVGVTDEETAVLFYAVKVRKVLCYEALRTIFMKPIIIILKRNGAVEFRAKVYDICFQFLYLRDYLNRGKII